MHGVRRLLSDVRRSMLARRRHGNRVRISVLLGPYCVYSVASRRASPPVRLPYIGSIVRVCRGANWLNVDFGGVAQCLEMMASSGHAAKAVNSVAFPNCRSRFVEQRWQQAGRGRSRLCGRHVFGTRRAGLVDYGNDDGAQRLESAARQ